jgi:hypothetical protein
MEASDWFLIGIVIAMLLVALLAMLLVALLAPQDDDEDF